MLMASIQWYVSLILSFVLCRMERVGKQQLREVRVSRTLLS